MSAVIAWNEGKGRFDLQIGYAFTVTPRSDYMLQTHCRVFAHSRHSAESLHMIDTLQKVFTEILLGGAEPQINHARTVVTQRRLSMEGRNKGDLPQSV
jgi:hypothetical protein